MGKAAMPLKKGLLEEQASSNPLPLLIFLYAIVPILTLIGIYCALTGKTQIRTNRTSQWLQKS